MPGVGWDVVPESKNANLHGLAFCLILILVARGGIEPPTQGFSSPRSVNASLAKLLAAGFCRAPTTVYNCMICNLSYKLLPQGGCIFPVTSQNNEVHILFFCARLRPQRPECDRRLPRFRGRGVSYQPYANVFGIVSIAGKPGVVDHPLPGG